MQLLNKADKLVVLGTGADLPVDNLKTILCISMLCGLPIVLDELSDIRACAKGIKVYAISGYVCQHNVHHIVPWCASGLGPCFYMGGGFDINQKQPTGSC